jgi:penicillin-binding protein 2
MITALAALEAGVIGPWDLVHCSGSFTYEGHTFACWNRYGHKNMNLYNAIKNSCDVYFYEVAIRTGIDRIAKMAQRFGLGQTYDCGIAGQKPGVVPNKAWKEMELGESWLGGETALAGIGQGYVLTTPLQLAVMTSRIATGRKVQPTLIKRKQPERFSSLGVNTGFLKHVRRGMYAVVNTNGGTAEDVAMNYKGVLLVGKTGTSQVRRNISRRKVEHMRWKDRPHALFVAYGSRKGRPNYAVAAIVEHGGSGAEEAAPLARDALLKILAYDPANYL